MVFISILTFMDNDVKYSIILIIFWNFTIDFIHTECCITYELKFRREEGKNEAREEQI